MVLLVSSHGAARLFPQTYNQKTIIPRKHRRDLKVLAALFCGLKGSGFWCLPGCLLVVRFATERTGKEGCSLLVNGKEPGKEADSDAMVGDLVGCLACTSWPRTGTILASNRYEGGPEQVKPKLNGLLPVYLVQKWPKLGTLGDGREASSCAWWFEARTVYFSLFFRGTAAVDSSGDVHEKKRAKTGRSGCSRERIVLVPF